MAADDDRGQTPDPWDEIVADGLGDGPGEVSFNFGDAVDSTAADGPGKAGEPEPAAASAEDALVDQWLNDDDQFDAEPPAEGPADEHAAGSSAIEIGTGDSGVAIHGEPVQEEIGAGDDATDEASMPEWPGVEETAGEGGAAAAAAPAQPARRPARPAKKSTGLGQLVGIVLGGAMAIPITLAILIYGLGKDPFGVTKQVPEQVAFLLPEKFRPGYRKPTVPKPDADAAEPSALDGLPAAPDTATEPAAEPTDVAAVDEAPMPFDPEPSPEPDAASVPEPGLDALDAATTPAAPAPLDTTALDEAVGEAAALCVAMGAADDTASGAFKALRKRWYRSLARVADELVTLENASHASGRPVTGVPDNVVALHATIGGGDLLRTELAGLAPFWLAAASRDSDGVVLPVTFGSSRKVGPYWSTRATLAGAGGAGRDVTIVSRAEPVAVAGDVVVVTGVALDREGTVIWAADVRTAAGGGLSAGF